MRDGISSSEVQMGKNVPLEAIKGALQWMNENIQWKPNIENSQNGIVKRISVYDLNQAALLIIDGKQNYSNLEIIAGMVIAAVYLLQNTIKVESHKNYKLKTNIIENDTLGLSK